MAVSRARSVPSSRRVHDLVGLALFFAGAACLLWLAWRQDALVPDLAVRGLRLMAGSGAFAVPLILLFIGSMFLVGYDRFSFSHSTYGTLLLFVTFITWRHLAAFDGPLPALDPASEQTLMGAGGFLGALVATLLCRPLGLQTAYLLLVMFACMSVVLLVDRPFIELLRSLRKPAGVGLAAARQGVGAAKQGVGAVREKSAAVREGLAARAAERAAGREEGGETPPERRLAPASLPGSGARKADAAHSARRPGPAKPASPPAIRDGADLAPAESTSVVPLPEGPAAPGDFRLPPLTLLKEAPPAPPRRAQQELADRIKVLEETLDQFGIGANVVEIAHGPTVTRYEIQLAPGIKVSKIVSLADNLAMALAAIDVRVEAPIPGKSAIGVEVPNSTASVVALRECIETAQFRNASGKLTFALGTDVGGTHRYADLTQMPHLLIGGSTNSGKSVCLNALIASMLYRATPREIKFVMIDPKRVELSLWDGIPHLMHPVVKDVKQAAGIFRAILKEMDRRYEMFSRIGTRNIDGYNEGASEDERLPFIVVVVDELADLMMQAAGEIETSICRIAQLARATGIHLVIATQRPSVDVITGLIKANISSRIAFAVSSQVDSRTILDMNGAERLIGRGDMLFLPIDSSKPARIQGCYLSEKETNALVAYLKEQERPSYTMTPVQMGMGGGAAGDEGGSEDELYESAVKLVATNGQASTSMLQRRFKIGYTRAARLVDMMEQRGIVGPLDGAKPREILVTKDEVDRMFRGDYED